MLKFLSILVAIYTLYAAQRGEVYAKHRAWCQTILHSDRPGYFWVVIGVYGLLALALLTIF